MQKEFFTISVLNYPKTKFAISTTQTSITVI